MREHFSVVIQCRELAGSLSFLDDSSEAIRESALVSLAIQQQVLAAIQIPSEFRTTFPVQQSFNKGKHLSIDMAIWGLHMNYVALRNVHKSYLSTVDINLLPETLLNVHRESLGRQ